jgi:NADH-ubiquinone oxidoreductase chain 4
MVNIDKQLIKLWRDKILRGKFLFESHKMLIISLLLIPLVGVLLVSTKTYHYPSKDYSYDNLVFKTNHDRYTKLVNDLTSAYIPDLSSHNGVTSAYIPDLSSHNTDQWNKRLKFTALNTSILTLFVSLVMFAFFDFSSNQFQFVQEYHEVSYFSFYLGVDGLSIYFVLLTTIIMPISLLSNWTSISHNLRSFLITILLLETLLLLVFLVLDILLFYIFFESILPPLFILIGLFGSNNRVRASFYLFLYTLLGSLFLLLSIVAMSSIIGTTDFDALYKTNFNRYTQLLLFFGIAIAFAVKTPIIFLNTWLLKAHVESPLSGSIILAGIVLKLSLYGILRLILPLLPKAYISCTCFIYIIGVVTIIYASISTLRTIDVKELIAYSSVSHAAVYLMGVFSNTVQGIEGGITLGLAHGFVSSGLFICAGGVLYDRSSTRLITYYRGIAQLMPLFSTILFILCLGNCGVPLTLNFVGEFLSLYGAFEKSALFGALASSSIILSAAYTIYMFNRIAFAGSYSKFFVVNISDLNKREFYILSILVLFTVGLGVYPTPVLDGLHYSVTTLIYRLQLDI